MLNKESESALKNALKDPSFPPNSVVKLTENRRTTLRFVLGIGLTLGKLPAIPGLGKRLSLSKLPKNCLTMLRQSGALDNKGPKRQSWEIPSKVWTALLQAAHEHGGKPTTDHQSQAQKHSAPAGKVVRKRRTKRRLKKVAKVKQGNGLVPFEAKQLLKALNHDPDFPGKEIITLSPAQRESFRAALFHGLGANSLPNLGLLGKVFREDLKRGGHDLFQLSRAGAVKNTAPRKRTWIVAPKVWLAIVNAVMDHSPQEVAPDTAKYAESFGNMPMHVADLEGMTTPPKPKGPKKVVGVHPSLDWSGFHDILSSEVSDLDQDIAKLLQEIHTKQEEVVRLNRNREEKVQAMAEVARHVRKM